MTNKEFKFLAMDDFSTMRRMVRSLPKELGLNSAGETEDGLNVLNKLQVGGYGLIISDQNTPSTNGLELLKAVRAGGAMSTLSMLIVTAEVKRESIIAAARAGAGSYMVEPLTAVMLEERLSGISEKLSM